MKIGVQKPIGRVAVSALLLLAAFLGVVPAVSALPPLTVNHFSGCSFSAGSGCSGTIQVAATGDVIVFTAQLNAFGGTAGNTVSVTSVSDGSSDVFAKIGAKEIVVGPGPNCSSGSSGCYDAEIWSTKTALAPGIYTITVVMSGIGSGVGTFGYLDTTGAQPQTGNVGSGSSASGVTSGHLTSSLSWTGPAIVISAVTIDGCSSASETFTPSAGFSPGCVLSNFPPAGMYATAATSPNNAAWSIVGGGSSQYAQFAAVFTAGLFTCSITNFDGGNYVVAGNGKFYNFFCEIQSSGVSTTNAMINQVKVRFNDSNTGSCTLTCFSTASPNIVILDYSNVTKQASLDSGSSVAILGTPNVVQGFNSATGVRSMNITFPVQMTVPFSVASLNRGIELYALLNGTAGSRGFEYVQTKYFNIIDAGNGGGGGVTLKQQGLCGTPPGADTFQMLCQYNASPKSWIAENATYYQLQHYQAQFSLETADPSGNPSPYYWQIFNETGTGCKGADCPSQNSGDWKIDAGLYTWDNTSLTCCWVKTIHVRLQTVMGRVGSNNLWTKFAAAWYDGSTLIANQTFHAFVPTDGGSGVHGQLGPSSVGIWLNFWYSQNNASMELGGEVGAYYTGMHNTGYLIWTSWSPFQGNFSNSQAFMPLKDHTGKLMSAQQAQMTKVYMNMSRPGGPFFAGQDNFQIITTNFAEQEFNTASQGMTGIVTPTFQLAVVPTVQSNSIFSPIINAIKSIATYFIKGLQAVGAVIWKALGSQFPWFTNFWSGVGGALVTFFKLFEDVIGSLISFLVLLASWFATLFNPIFNTITAAWTQINSLLAWLKYVPTQDIGPTIEVFVIIVFGLSLLEALFTNDWPYIIKLVSGAWRITEAILTWTWRLAKFVVDTIVGLIP